jgi:hypothetical protein
VIFSSHLLHLLHFSQDIPVEGDSSGWYFESETVALFCAENIAYFEHAGLESSPHS